MNNTQTDNLTIGIAGTGAIGSAVARALINGIDGLTLTAACDPTPNPELNIPYVSIDTLIDRCDIIIECLPPAAAPELAIKTLKHPDAAQKTLILISSCALLIYPEILDTHRDIPKGQQSRIIVPSGALLGIDGVKALKKLGIKSSKIASTKKPLGFTGAPYVEEMGIDLGIITEPTRIFKGNATEAAKGFPANVNVAATLSLAGIGAQDTSVEIWADPDITGNTHEIEVIGEFSQISAKITNHPDPANPKSSMLAAQSIIACLEDMNSALIIL